MSTTLSMFTLLFMLILNILNLKATETKEETKIQLLTPKDQIFPFLSPEQIRQSYNDLKNLYPQFNLSEWSESLYVNNVLDLKESKILYRVSSLKPILYSPKNKTAIIVDNFDVTIPSQSPCAFLLSQKIVLFRTQTLSGSDQNFNVAENKHENEFFVTDEYFGTIAYGKVSATEFQTYKYYIYEAQTLKGLRKCFLQMRYCTTIPFLYYLKCISPFLNFWINFFPRAHDWMSSSLDKCYDIIDDYCFFCSLWGCMTRVYLILWPIFYICGLIVKIPIMLTCLYIKNSITYHTIMFPFHVLGLPVPLFFFKFNFFLFCGCPVTLFFVNFYFFPKFMDDFLIKSIFQWDLNKMFLPSISSFDIKPKNKMMLLPFLIPKSSLCCFYVKILIFQFLFSLMFKSVIENWV